jgi:uncharacterized membrane protein YcaP (DUF421 family)
MDWIDSLQTLVGRDGHDLTAAQMSARAVIIFVYALVLLRLAHKRILGRWSVLDVVLAIIIGSNFSRALTGNAPLGPALVASTVLVGLHTVLVWAAARWEGLGPLVKGRASKLVADGVIDRAALRRHGIGLHDLDEGLRSAGLDDVGAAKAAYLERNGEISVIRR